MSQPLAEDGPAPPLLVIVSGAPASGKTTLARRVASELRLRAVIIHLSDSSQLSSDRFRARFERGERHPAHLDAATVATPGDFWKDGWWRWELPLELGVPALVVDTNDGHVADLSDILAFIRAR